ncbi:uncharacterized protein OCT59_003191 [Rhizophagus irregularis]|nr:hypothetical protein OCT59_003191 [Rhizophagus irregularis]GBC37043.2 hypothetical protein GLOIN_2v1645543 [Rhizophagus irregularis DAOM 181602=DAOM 197198]CAB5193113.1 unnamed protein product [Rhizophagus irregularis]
MFILNFPDTSVNVFNILLVRYIYDELCDYVQYYLIEHHQTWLFQNFVLTQQVNFKYSEFTILQDYWIATVCIQPEIIIFEATDFTSIGKEVLLSLYRNENLYIEEYELWDHIIRWVPSNDLYQDILKYHLVANRQPNLIILRIDSIMSKQCSFVPGFKEQRKQIYYEFRLLTRESRDGFNREIFHTVCDKEYPTITIMRLQNETLARKTLRVFFLV